MVSAAQAPSSVACAATYTLTTPPPKQRVHCAAHRSTYASPPPPNASDLHPDNHERSPRKVHHTCRHLMSKPQRRTHSLSSTQAGANTKQLSSTQVGANTKELSSSKVGANHEQQLLSSSEAGVIHRRLSTIDVGANRMRLSTTDVGAKYSSFHSRSRWSSCSQTTRSSPASLQRNSIAYRKREESTEVAGHSESTGPSDSTAVFRSVDISEPTSPSNSTGVFGSVGRSESAAPSDSTGVFNSVGISDSAGPSNSTVLFGLVNLSESVVPSGSSGAFEFEDHFKSSGPSRYVDPFEPTDAMCQSEFIRPSDAAGALNDSGARRPTDAMGQSEFILPSDAAGALNDSGARRPTDATGQSEFNHPSDAAGTLNDSGARQSRLRSGNFDRRRSVSNSASLTFPQHEHGSMRRPSPWLPADTSNRHRGDLPQVDDTSNRHRCSSLQIPDSFDRHRSRGGTSSHSSRSRRISNSHSHYSADCSSVATDDDADGDSIIELNIAPSDPGASRAISTSKTLASTASPADPASTQCSRHSTYPPSGHCDKPQPHVSLRRTTVEDDISSVGVFGSKHRRQLSGSVNIELEPWSMRLTCAKCRHHGFTDTEFRIGRKTIFWCGLSTLLCGPLSVVVCFFGDCLDVEHTCNHCQHTTGRHRRSLAPCARSS